MDNSIRVRLSNLATTELLKLMEVYELESPTHTVNFLITKMYHQTLNSHAQEAKSYENSNLCQN